MSDIEREIGNPTTRARLVASATRILGNAADAEDCVQDALLQASRTAWQYQGRGTAGAWLYRVVINACRMQRRAMRRQRRGGTNVHIPMDELTSHEPAAGGDPAEILEGREALSAVFDELTRVPERDASLFERCMVEDLPLRVVAEQSRMTRQALKSRLFRVRRRLAERLEADLPLSA